MKECLTIVLIGCMSAAGLAQVAGLTCAAPEVESDDLAKLRKEVATLRSEVKALQGQLAELKETRQRNPFGFADVPDPDGKDVQAFAAQVKLLGDARDANAEQWAREVTAGHRESLDGEWYGRWNFTGRPW